MARSAKASRGKRKKLNKSATPAAQPARPFKKQITVGLAALTLLALVGSIVVSSIGGRGGGYDLNNLANDQADVVLAKHAYRTDGPRKLDELLELNADDLEDLDIALINLICAAGLPGGDGIDIDGTLATLDAWAAHVEQETEWHLYKFHQNPDEWGTEARWRMAMLITVLQRDCGVRYNPERIRDVDFTKSKDLYIHGMVEPGMKPIRWEDNQQAAENQLNKTNGGTCTSMPVLYTAIARRLGYPVVLASTKGHRFCRWDGKASGGHENPAYRDYFNIEGTNRGINIYDDEYYLAWPYRVTPQEVQANAFLKSNTNKKDLASFMATRADCLMALNRLQDAADTYQVAADLHPECRFYQQFVHHTYRQMVPPEARQPGMAGIMPRAGERRGRVDPVEQINRLNAENRRRMDAWTRQHEQYNQQSNQQQGFTDPWPAQNNNPQQPSHQGF